MLIKSLKCALAAVLVLTGVSDVLAQKKKSTSKESKKSKKSYEPPEPCMAMRRLSHVDERQLFALLEGEELKNQLDAVYGENGGSEILEHYQSRDQLSSDHVTPPPEDGTDLDPFVAPSYKGATLLAADPGLWTIDDFAPTRKRTNLLPSWRRRTAAMTRACLVLVPTRQFRNMLIIILAIPRFATRFPQGRSVKALARFPVVQPMLSLHRQPLC
jgi:hypothetical protein